MIRYAFLALLAAAPAAAQPVAARVPVCNACHGATGTSATAGVPSLGGMSSDYVVIQLYMFRENRRVVAPMNAMAHGLSDDDLRTLGDTIAAMPPPKPSGDPLPSEQQEQGRALTTQYHCSSCHGADFAGHDQMPRLAGQQEAYLAKALTEYKSNARAGYDPAMNEASQDIKAEDIPILARYLAQYR